MRLQRELEIARTAAARAADIVMAVYAKDFAVDWKGENDPVTVADRSANDEIVRILRSEFPEDLICSEEADMAQSAAQSKRGGRCWFVDPLDGTREFVAKNGEFSVMIGLAVDGVPVLGCVRAPVWEQEYFAIVGEGASARALGPGLPAEQPLVAREGRSDQTLRMAVSRSHREQTVNLLMDRIGAAPIECGSVGLKVALVLSERASIYAHTGGGAKLWDGCAPHAIALAAGLTFTDSFGTEIRYDTDHLPLDRGILVAERTLHSRATSQLSLLRERK